ncbi:MAG: hypothetical protein Kow0091_21220 [Geminocystis sp.]|uniref:Uncharacterized protein n=2 Tax=Cyanobacterium TaxID=102234 RepID=K9Z699_CYAAP|nr:hypothetical protein Cyan10605_2621 [Cyanobacterium aponinum PCC 10605]
MAYLDGWKEFCYWIKMNPDAPLPDGVNLSELYRFAARYRLSYSYQGINLQDYPEQSVEAYGCLLGVFLAYSAFEQLYKAVGLTQIRGKHIVEEWAIENESIAEELRKSHRVIDFLHDKVDTNGLKRRIIEFKLGNNHNILILAQSIRHLVAHGVMTVHGGNVNSKTSIGFCNILKENLDNKTQYCFENYVLNPIIVK